MFAHAGDGQDAKIICDVSHRHPQTITNAPVRGVGAQFSIHVSLIRDCCWVMTGPVNRNAKSCGDSAPGRTDFTCVSVAFKSKRFILEIYSFRNC